ncbi:MAG: glycerophosphodiester phosphodiesterase, partial [Acidobacteria bacterium]|nr:glycerophosphodiester phosphodiesterase [Acidobacteriota bacterium]
MHTPLLLGHRGDRTAGPENTFSAFDRSLNHGCDGFEFDVRLTRDGQAVVLHDPKISGMTIASTSFSRLSANRHRREVGNCLPLLDDVIHRYAGRAFL